MLIFRFCSHSGNHSAGFTRVKHSSCNFPRFVRKYIQEIFRIRTHEKVHERTVFPQESLEKK
ncbi:MAG: hypothetical protein CW338_00070 [Clostridiales bacterium]|nr:hypothetical protein [Clostridiales bacterium]